jgi:hypothetical protein
MENNCENCKFWQEDGEIPGLGSCHRYAPNAVVSHPVQVPGSMDTDWPRTKNDEWCGEWDPRAPL